MTTPRNSIKSSNSQLDQVEERISEPILDRSFEAIQLEEQKERRMKRNKVAYGSYGNNNN